MHTFLRFGYNKSEKNEQTFTSFFSLRAASFSMSTTMKKNSQFPLTYSLSLSLLAFVTHFCFFFLILLFVYIHNQPALFCHQPSSYDDNFCLPFLHIKHVTWLQTIDLSPISSHVKVNYREKREKDIKCFLRVIKYQLRKCCKVWHKA
jgi:hypothetical protein